MHIYVFSNAYNIFPQILATRNHSWANTGTRGIRISKHLASFNALSTGHLFKAPSEKIVQV